MVNALASSRHEVNVEDRWVTAHRMRHSGIVIGNTSAQSGTRLDVGRGIRGGDVVILPRSRRLRQAMHEVEGENTKEKCTENQGKEG